MPAGLIRPNSQIEPVVGIQFGIFSPEEIERRSVVEITNQGTYENNEPKIGGLFDPRMGVIDNGKTCRSCGQTNHNCPGHFGHYRLARPVYYIQFIDTVMDVLKCVCIQCSKLLIDKDVHKNILKRRGEGRWKEVKAKCANISRCGQETEDGCGARQPKRYLRTGVAGARIVAVWDPVEGRGAAVEGGKTEQIEQILETEYVLRLFRRITDDDVDFMGFSRYWCRPDWMICTVLPIPPPQVRPSVVQDNNQRSEDDLTFKLFDIIKTNQALKQRIEQNATFIQINEKTTRPPNSAPDVIGEYTSLLQYHVATLVNNQLPGVAPSAQRSGRPLKSIQQRLGSKEGRIRFNIQGKRVEFSARSVITPDPNLSIAEIGVPLKIAMNLTVPERVTTINRAQLYKYVRNGAEKHPGAKTIIQKSGRMISLRHVNREEIVLRIGDTVNRHLVDGDIILFNRQPTLHRMSMMGHRVRVLPYNTFRLNVSVTAPYNADFDGDEMNAHIPQSYEASTELSEIAAVPNQIISPRLGVPVIGIVQDTCVGTYRMTRNGVALNRREFMNLMMWNKRFMGTLPKAKLPKQKFTGHQVISQIIPPVNMEMMNKQGKEVPKEQQSRPEYNIKIVEGEVLQGQFDKDTFSKPSKGLVHVSFNDYSSDDTVKMIDCMQNTVEQFLITDGFSVGISDLVADSGTLEQMQQIMQKRKQEVENIILQIHLDLFENNSGRTNEEEFENKVFKALNEANSEAGKQGLASLADENRLVAMVRAGSKGSTFNIAQMIACLGQISIEGKRISYGFNDRTLPHYKKYDDSAEARGFAESSFIRGLTPQEFFFHAMSGREGLIDTAVKTATTGYIQRRLIKAMEDLTVQFDGTVRDARGNIVQFRYGEDGVNATKIENVNMSLQGMSAENIRNTYGMVGTKWEDILMPGVPLENPGTELATFIDKVLEDRRMLVEGVNRGKMDRELHSPVNIERLLNNLQAKFKIDPSKNPRTDLQPAYVIKNLESVIKKTQSYHRIWAAAIRFYCAPHKLIVQRRFNKLAFDTLCELLVVKNWQSWVQPGELVGIIAAQSIGEPSTQMTLNTFHLAGVAAKSNMTRGVPRLEELLKVTQNPKAIALTVFLRPEYRQIKEKAREVAQDLGLTLLRDITIKAAIYYDPKDEETIQAEDRDLIKFFKLFELGDTADATATEVPNPFSKWVLRLELDREKMFNKNITMDDIAFVLETHFRSTINSTYSDFNSTKLVMRIRLEESSMQGDDLLNLKKFQNRLLNSVVMHGLPGIKTATFREEDSYVEEDAKGEYKKIKEYIIDTDGTNFIEVMNHPAVDGRRILSTHPYDIYENLGIEATRATLLSEIQDLFEDAPVNIRHIGLLTDVMTRTGRLMSVDRYGINKTDIGPLAKASFEETEKILLRAAQFGEVDPVTGVASNIMMGQPIRGGTAFSQILLDESAMLNLMKGLPAVVDEEEEEEEDEDYIPTEDDISRALAQTAIPPVCRDDYLGSSMVLPKASKLIADEENIELIEMEDDE
jgi:DNA-directed RNA polymerase II subunit RPB1